MAFWGKNKSRDAKKERKISLGLDAFRGVELPNEMGLHPQNLLKEGWDGWYQSKTGQVSSDWISFKLKEEDQWTLTKVGIWNWTTEYAADGFHRRKGVFGMVDH